jgi:hypothetical protein
LRLSPAFGKLALFRKKRAELWRNLYKCKAARQLQVS